MSRKLCSSAPSRGIRRLSPRRTSVLVTGGVVAALAAGVGLAGAAVPAAPDNLVVFPDRDFVTIEGFQDRVGQTALVQVFRGQTVIGSAESVVAEGDVAFEINHPGGVCWGAGTTHKVTPDIRPGDRVAISFGGELAGDTTVQDASVQAKAEANGTTLTVTGRIGAGVSTARLEQRIVNPDLVDLVGRRDVRALPGPLTPSPKGGYSSGLEINGSTFTATYEFDQAQAAAVAAAGGGERMMAWEVEDGDANRQGLSIAEFGELGGPGMGGCPAGPTDQGAPQPGTAAAVRSSDKTQLQVSWTPATPAPGAAAVTGYSVVAIADTASSSGERVELGRRTSASATRATITGLTASEGYTVEVRSLAGPRMSEAFSVTAAAPPATPPSDQTRPVVTASPAATDGGVTEAERVTLSSESTADIYYTTDGSPALDNGDLPSDAAKLYTGPIAITERTTIHYVAFDRAGNFADAIGVWAPPAAPAPAPPVAPSLGTSAGGQGQVTMRWSSTDATVTGYGVQLYNAAGATVGDLRETAATSMTVGELSPGTYTFTVKARNGEGYGEVSARSAALTVTAVTDRITIATARWRAGDFRITGSGSVAGVTVTVRRVNADGTPGAAIGTGAMTAAAPPATGGTFSLRFRNGAAPATNPGRIFVTSSQGGQAGPFTVTNG